MFSRKPDNNQASTPQIKISDQEFAANFFRLFGRADTSAICGLAEELCITLSSRQFAQAREKYQQLTQRMEPAVSEPEIKWLLNYPYRVKEQEDAQSVLYRAIAHKADRQTLAALLKDNTASGYLFDIKRERSINGKQFTDTFHECNLGHLAAIEHNLDAIIELRAAGYNLDLSNREGLTPLTLLLKRGFGVSSDNKTRSNIMDHLFSTSDHGRERYSSEHPLEAALAYGEIYFALEICASNFPPPTRMKNRKFAVQVDGQHELVGYNELAKMAIEKHIAIMSDESPFPGRLDQSNISDEATDLFNYNRNIYHYYLYLDSYLELTEQQRPLSNESFVRLAIAVNTGYPLSAIQHLLMAIDAYQDGVYYDRLGRSFTPGHHPNEAELLLLLAHPDLQQKFNANLGSLVTRALTSPYRYYDFKVTKIDMSGNGWQMISNWQRAGQLTHSHLNWRFDSISPKDEAGRTLAPSLLESYGFRRISRSAYLYDQYGATFSLRPSERIKVYEADRPAAKNIRRFHPDAAIILSRGNIIITDPYHGTLLIRNSSLVFGRDSMSHPVFYSRRAVGRGFSYRDLIESELPGRNLGFVPLLDFRINGIKRGRFSSVANRSEEIMSLIDQFTAFQIDYRQWKFDTDPHSAFRRRESGITKDDILGAYNSEGFSALARNLSFFYQQAEKTGKPQLLPELAFYDTFEPPWLAHQYAVPNIGSEQPSMRRSFKIDSYSLEVLRDLAAGNYSREDFYASGLKHFFQAGVTARANLLMIAANQG